MSEAKKILVLGSGMVGSVIALDLARDPALSVTVSDLSDRSLDRVRSAAGVETVQADLSRPERIRDLAKGFDVAVGALPGFLGLQTLEAVIEAGCDYCDISFMPEDFLALDEAARERGVTAVVDCGVAPGMSNMLVGRAASRLDTVDTVSIYVGGLPAVRTLPFQYKAPFSPVDVIEEYVRPARIRVGGRDVTRPALSEPELLTFEGVGTLEAFLTDGLRSLLRTVDARTMVEKTMRWPGHRELMLAFRETGLFGEDPVDVAGTPVRPVDLVSALLFPQWTYGPGEVDFTVMRIAVEGEKAGARAGFRWDLLDYADPATGFSSMARTTGFPAAVVTRLLSQGRIEARGVLPPEVLGREPGFVETVLDELAERGVRFQAIA